MKLVIFKIENQVEKNSSYQIRRHITKEATQELSDELVMKISTIVDTVLHIPISVKIEESCIDDINSQKS